MFGRNTSRKEKELDGYDYNQPSKDVIKRATRTRFIWSLVASFFLLITVVFLILVELGDTSKNNILNKIYFINLNLSDIVPVSIPNSKLINSIAQSLGLHDFYTVGLWGFCEGYNGQGTTHCSDPKALYWFDPVKIIANQLLSGATIALPNEINSILKLVRIVSHWMFGLFLTGVCLGFVMMFIVPLSVYSRWATLPIMIFTFLTALFTTVASILATVMFTIMKDAITKEQRINIVATLGIQMFAYMWVASAASIIAWIITLCLSCCCASRRDVRTGRKSGSKKAWRDSEMTTTTENGAERGQGSFMRQSMRPTNTRESSVRETHPTREYSSDSE